MPHTTPRAIGRARTVLPAPNVEPACANADPDLFFIDRGEDPEPAKQICYRCSHRQPCLRFALTTRQEFGIWGGTTPAERAKFLRAHPEGTAS